jgi:myosin heavy subunit
MIFALSVHYPNVPNEKSPTPITRGIEIQKAKNEAIRSKSSDASGKVADLSRLVHERIDAEYAKGPDAGNFDRLIELHEQDRALEEIARKLEDIIIRHDEFDEALNEQLSEMHDRMSRTER